MDDSLFWLITAASAAHVAEEYVLGWKRWVFETTQINVSSVDFFLINFSFIMMGICFSMIGWKHPQISLCLAGVTLINAIFFHLLPTIIRKRLSPGVITSFVLYLPLSFFTYYTAYKIQNVSIDTLFISLLGGLLLMSFPLLLQKTKHLIRSKESAMSIKHM